MNINPIKIILLVFVLSTFFSCNRKVKSEQIIAKNKATELGKSVWQLDNKIWVIFQDSKENYWFGSNGEGVFYLNGKDLKQITTENGLVDNKIRGVQEDKSGNIFIETTNGISKYDGQSLTTLKPIVSSKNKWKLELNDLWFGYNANDVYRYDGDSLYELKLPRQNLKKTFGIDTLVSPFNNNNPYSVYKVNKDKDGNIWFGTFVAGAFRYDGQSFIWFGENELSILPNGTAPGVRSMIQDKDGYFWLSNFISKYKIEPNTLEYKKINGIEKDKPNYFNSGLSDKNGDLWMTNYGGMVWKYDGKTLSEFEINTEEKDVLLITIYEDNNGIIWLGTDNDGVYRSNGKSFEKFELNK
jgi:ligand-binding sensor domain-containing protein